MRVCVRAQKMCMQSFKIEGMGYHNPSHTQPIMVYSVHSEKFVSVNSQTARLPKAACVVNE